MDSLRSATAIIITTINPPTEAILSYSRLEGARVFVAGDNKTPENWITKNVEYISVEHQAKLPYKICNSLPYNHYSRKMVGYVMAIKEGYSIIVDTDDDNFPKPDWRFPEFINEYRKIGEGLGFINIYRVFTEQKIWPRGLPLNKLNSDLSLNEHINKEICNVGIWQGLADEDPDVDAVYRLTSNAPCVFKIEDPVVLGKGTIAPINSQNTIFRKEAFPLLYLPVTVTFRFTDILRGLVAQPILWESGFEIGFLHATVIQKRNAHDFMADFISEIPMYQHSESITDYISGSINSSRNISDNLLDAYRSLYQKEIVKKAELITLEAWLKDIDLP
jgi:hypothetical protein